MEILNTTHHYIEFWTWIFIVGLFTLVFVFLMCVGCFDTIRNSDYTSANIVPCLVVTAISFLGIACLMIMINDGVRVTHEVKVNDWNKVHEQGYKVIKQKGEIVTVELIK